jgi:hypothetical protein
MGFLQRWAERLEATPAVARFGLAWVLCLVPRSIAVWGMGPIGDYLQFTDPTARTEAFWYPAYEALAHLLWAISGGILGVYVALHLALHAALGPLVYSTCVRLKLPALTGWLAVFGVALLPYYISLAARQPQVGVVISFVAGALLVFLRWRDSDLAWRHGLTFALFGFFSALLRPNLLLSVGALYALALGCTAIGSPGFDAGGRPRATGRILASGAVLGLLLVGLAAVSKVHTGHASPFAPVAGHNLYLGHNERLGEYLRRHDILSVEDIVRDHGFPAEAAAIENIYERDPVLGRLGLDYALQHPGETIVNTGLKALRYWDVRLEDAENNPLLWNLAFTGPYLVYGSLALLGTWWMLRDGRGLALAILAALLVSYWIPHLVLFPTIRMRMTTEFVLIVLAAYAAGRLLAPRSAAEDLSSGSGTRSGARGDALA